MGYDLLTLQRSEDETKNAYSSLCQCRKCVKIFIFKADKTYSRDIVKYDQAFNSWVED